MLKKGQNIKFRQDIRGIKAGDILEIKAIHMNMVYFKGSDIVLEKWEVLENMRNAHYSAPRINDG